MKTNITLGDLYKFTTDENGSIIMSSEEKQRFEENFKDYLQIRYAIKHNPYALDVYNKLYVYSQWYNDI